MTARSAAPPAIDPRQLERAGRIWFAAQNGQRQALVMMGLGYESEFYAAREWSQLGSATQADIARGLARLCLLIRQAAKEPRGDANANSSGD